MFITYIDKLVVRYTSSLSHMYVLSMLDMIGFKPSTSAYN